MTAAPDLLVVGGGTAALAATRAAVRKGATAVMVTDGPPGGDCTFTGCVPSKTLLSSTSLPFPDAMARVRATVEEIAADESAEVLRAEGVEVLEGRAEVLAKDRVQVDGKVLAPRRLVLATGTRPSVPPLDGLATTPYLTNESVFALTTLPRHLLVLGGGPIGCELAQAFRRLGSAVTLLESAPRLLGRDEPAAGEVVRAALVAEGVDVRLGAQVSAAARARGGVRLVVDGAPVSGSHLLVATGRSPVTESFAALGLELTDRGAVRTDLRMRTSTRGVWAAGDVTGRAPFTHAADEMGRVAAMDALSRLPGLRFAAHAVPWVTFTDPEVARVGLSEDEAARTLTGARVVELPFTDVDRARTSGRTEGFVKVVVAPRRLTRDVAGGRVVGATVVGPRAGEALGELSLAVRTGMFAARIALTAHAYPTWSVAVQQAVAQLFGGYGGREPRPARRDP